MEAGQKHQPIIHSNTSQLDKAMTKEIGNTSNFNLNRVSMEISMQYENE
jgi:hypothetical protein